jgi:hypothetical protein
MAIQLSPSVVVREIDLTNVIPAVSTSIGAAVIEAAWGPVMDVTSIDSENVLVQRFGKPNNYNAANWFSAANFLAYSGQCLIVRSDTTNQRNAVAKMTGSVNTVTVNNGGAGYSQGSTSVVVSAPNTVASSVTEIPVVFGGSGYSQETVGVTISAPSVGGVQAEATAIVDGNGAIVQVIITNPGSGYTTVPTAAITGANTEPAILGAVQLIDGSPGVQATASVTVLQGAVASISGGLGGSGYTDGADIVFSSPTGSGGVIATGTAQVTGGAITGYTITNPGRGYITAPTISVAGGTGASPAVAVLGGYVASIQITNPGTGYATSPTVTVVGPNTIPAQVGTVTIVQSGVKVNNLVDYTSFYDNGEGVVGEFAAKYPGSLGNSIRVSMADADSFENWVYKSQFDAAPNTSSYAADRQSFGDELHIVVVDRDGRWSGVAGTVLESFAYVSKASDAKKEDGSTAYYKDVINNQSAYVWWMDHPAIGTNWGTTAVNTNYASLGVTPVSRDLVGGVDHFTATNGQRIDGFDLFTNDEELDVNLIVTGKSNPVVANWVIQNLAEFRKDCVAFVSPQDVNSGEVLVGNTSDIAEKIVAFRNQLPSSSYYVIDSGYKYQYDRYNDTYRWVPLNGDIAGLCARTDYTDDPWYSPAGLNRGGIKNVVRLAYSPRKADRDTLYKSGVNPVVSFPGQGVVLYGDKTGLSKPSAFDRINVRRLFIVLEKAIATAAKYQLFEFNDPFTRATFRNMTEPFLRDVKGRRGVYDFRVVCDETNNTPEVIDTNRFVADIYIKPARSINFIQLNFIATRTGASFTEIAAGNSI